MDALVKENNNVKEIYFTRVFESFRVTGADRLPVNFFVDRLVNLFAFRVVDYGHADVLQPRRNWTFCVRKRRVSKTEVKIDILPPFFGDENKQMKIYFRRVYPIQRRRTGRHRIPYPCPASRWATYSIGMRRAE